MKRIGFLSALVACLVLAGCGAEAQQAFEKMRQQAEQGDPEAQLELAFMYAEGKGIKRDAEQAIAWARKAAQQGHAEAQTELAYAYDVRGEHEEAVRWYYKAATQGYPKAQYNLAVSYAIGEGVKRNDVLAYKWYSLATQDEEQREDAIQNLRDLEEKMTQRQIRQAKQLAAEQQAKRRKP